MKDTRLKTGRPGAMSWWMGVAATTALALTGVRAWAAPPAPTGGHPRLFMDSETLAAYTANAARAGSRAAIFAKRCQDTLDHPEWFMDRGGADGDNFPGAALSCAFAYTVNSDATKKSQYLTQAIKYWKAAMNDVDVLGDGKGCVAGVSTNWKDTGSGRPPVISPVGEDTGYGIRWYAPDLALTYDWLYNAPGVGDSLRTQTQVCLGAWLDWYTQAGYLHDQPGANYNAGFVVGKAFSAVALAGDTGAAGNALWADTVDNLFGGTIIGKGLAGTSTGVGTPAGALVGGDWPEGWQYGPLSVAEYAVAARALEEAGAPLPDMDAWTNSLIVRYAYGTLPKFDMQYVGNGDFAPNPETLVYKAPSANQLDAVLAGPSGEQAASWAAYYKQQQNPQDAVYFYNVLAETRTVSNPQDFRAQTPAPPLWYLARGTRALYARTDWSANAFWAVFASPPHLVSDHLHFAASNFVFSRGGDHLIVDPSRYGEAGSLETNALTADSPKVSGDYAPSQTPWSKADLPWARGAQSGVFAARSDFTRAFDFSEAVSDIPYAHREWVMLPEGEVVAIDRIHTLDSSHFMYVNLHVNTNGSLKLANGVATGTVGGSSVAIHQVLVSGGKASIQSPAFGNDCSTPFGSCNVGRFKVDQYFLKVPGPWAVAIHVVDGLDSTEDPAIVGSLNDTNYDPAQANSGVIGAAVYRASKQSYVVASSAQDGASSSTMVYGVPAESASRHVVFDAPENGDGKSTVNAAVDGTRCNVTITAGGDITGRPLMFQVSSAADGCSVTEDTNVAPGVPPPGGGSTGKGGDGGGPMATGGSGGCACALVSQDVGLSFFSTALLALVVGIGTRRRRT